MVFNSLALFFLIELDDLLVQDEDFEDIEEFIGEFRRRYNKNKQANRPTEEDISKQCCSQKGLTRCDCCVDSIQFVLVTCIYVGAIVCPVLVGLCW